MQHSDVNGHFKGTSECGSYIIDISNFSYILILGHFLNVKNF